MQRWLLASTAALAAAAAPRRVAVTGAGGQTGQLAFRRMLARRDELRPVHKSNSRGASPQPLDHGLHAIDATPARRRGGASSSPLDRASTAAFSLEKGLSEELSVTPHTG